MDWLIEDYESFFFGLACGSLIVLLAAWYVIGRVHKQLRKLLRDYEGLNSETD